VTCARPPAHVIVTVAVRPLNEPFGAAVNKSVPLPLPAPAESVSHVASLAACHPHVPVVCAIVMVPWPPVKGTPRIAVGAPANLVLVDPNASWRVKEESFRSRSANSWLLGKTLRSKIRMTVADGRVAFAT